MTPFTPSVWIKLKMKYSLILVGLVVYLSVPALIPAGIECQQIIEEKDDDGQSRQSNKLLSLFDWNSYMRFYDKQYSSLAQQLVRQKLFVARVLQVFLTQAKYRMYQLNYYTAINKWSDLTPKESKNLLSGDQSDFNEPNQLTDDATAREVLLEILGNQQGENAESVEDELKKERSRIVKLRKRRSAEDRNRELSAANLVKGGGEADIIKPDPNLKIKWIVSSNNPDYEPNIASTSIEDLQENVEDISQSEISELAKQPQLTYTPSTAFSLLRSTFSGAVNWLAPDRNSDEDEDDDEEEGDEEEEEEEEEKDETVVVRDWRRSGCIGPARDQGYCASCYAVSSMAFLEWALCSSRDREFTPLSVQYMVSCGRQLGEETKGAIRLEGCKHGISRHTQDFIREYGVELEVNMPYVAKETQCPVERGSPRKTKGYIRPNVKPPLRLGATTTQLDLALKVGPIIVSMREPIDFLGYGGGMVENCEPTGGHAMLIVGDMIQDGQEYLLIKNSFGPYWGYQGFFKFRRSSIKECVKEFIVPMVSFPGRKSQARRVKAYLAHQQSKITTDDLNRDDSVISLASLVSA